MDTLTLQPLVRALFDKLGVASTHSSDASELPSKRTVGSLKQTHLGLELLDCISVRFVICSQKQEGSVTRKRSENAHRNSCHHSNNSNSHHQVQLNKAIYPNSTLHHYSSYIYCFKSQLGTLPFSLLGGVFSVFRVSFNFLKLLAIIYISNIDCLSV
jgi:hypothetical protein